MAFPLLRLPFLALENLMDFMENKEKLCISLTSQKAQKVFKFLNTHTSRPRTPIIIVKFTNPLEIQLGKYGRIQIRLRTVETSNDSAFHPVSMHLELDNQIIDISKEELSVRECIIRFMEVLNCSKVGLSFFKNFVLYENIRKSLDGLNIVRIQLESQFDDMYTQFLLKKYNFVKEISFINLPDQKIFREVSRRELDYLKLVDQISLPELLQIKSFYIDIWTDSFTSIQLNTFLKSWINGESNQTLKSIYTFYEGYRQELLDGIDFQERTEDDMYSRPYQFHALSSDVEENLKNGLDIQRKDGVKATILLREFSLFKFVVW